MGTDTCPICQSQTSRIAIQMYGRCYHCEEKERRTKKTVYKKLIRPDRLELLAFYHELLGRALH